MGGPPILPLHENERRFHVQHVAGAMRRLIFWLHLAAGITAGAVILTMSVTGVLLAYERQITAWADGYRLTPPPAARRLSVEALLGAAIEARPGALPTAFSLRADPAAPAAVSFGRGSTLFLDPYRGTVLGEGSGRARSFFGGRRAGRRRPPAPACCSAPACAAAPATSAGTT
jgi:hypothetical protein